MKKRFKMTDRMNAIKHLEELRRRLIYTLTCFLVAFLLCLVFVSRIYHYLVSPLARNHESLVVVTPGEIVGVFLSISTIAAIGLVLPFALWQLWLFVSTGLRETEKRFTLRLLPVVLLMFIVGVCFSWFVVFPTILHFLISITEQQGLGMFLRANSYFDFLTSIVLPFGFIFELPIVVVILTGIGVITPKILRKIRRYAYLAIVCLGVLISPPELISHLSVTLPMITLYELSVLLSVVVHRRKPRNSMHSEFAAQQ